MKHLVAFIALVATSGQAGSAPRPPIQPGQYTFQHRFAEHPGIRSISVTARIDGIHIVLTNHGPPDVFPKGVVAEGTLMWHAGARQWIIGHEPSDRHAKEVGGCSDGPEVIDLRTLIYWTC